MPLFNYGLLPAAFAGADVQLSNESSLTASPRHIPFAARSAWSASRTPDALEDPAAGAHAAPPAVCHADRQALRGPQAQAQPRLRADWCLAKASVPGTPSYRTCRVKDPACMRKRQRLPGWQVGIRGKPCAMPDRCGCRLVRILKETDASVRIIHAMLQGCLHRELHLFPGKRYAARCITQNSARGSGSSVPW
jgi:hypothetical protein